MKTKKDINAKKIMLYISLGQYVFIFLYGLYYAIFGYTFEFYREKTIYGLETFISKIEDIWLDNIIDFNFIGIIELICTIYLIWYFIDTNKSTRKINIRKIVYIISIACWIIYALSGVYALFFGYNTGIITTHRVYGGEALVNALVMNLFIFSIIPILPISLIYIILYLKKKNSINT